MKISMAALISILLLSGCTGTKVQQENLRLVNHAKQQLDSWRGDSSVLDAAKMDIDLALKNAPSYPPTYVQLARYYIMDGYISNDNFQTGSLEAAERALNKAIDIDPEYADAYVLFGSLYRNMHRPNEAKSALIKAEKLGTNSPWLHLNWAHLLLDEGRFKEAALRYRKVISSGTDNKKAMLSAIDGLISCDWSLKNFDEIDGLYRKQIAIEPATAWSYGNYARFLLCVQDKYDDAIVQARKALDIMDYGVGHYILGSALYRKWAGLAENGDSPEETEQTLQEARTVYPDVTDLVQNTDICPPMKHVVAALATTPRAPALRTY